MTNFWHRINKTIYDKAIRKQINHREYFGGNVLLLVLRKNFDKKYK